MRALVTGITGQDGAYLAKFLLEKDYEVYGLYRRSSSPNFWRLANLGIAHAIQLIPGDMTDMASISNAIIRSQPDEIYNLAAQSFVGTSFEQPLFTAAVDGLGPVALLEAAKQAAPKAKIYHASTSELFGSKIRKGSMLDENSLFWPVSPYAASKLYAFHIVRIYREAYGMFAVNGILFNHESPLRGLEFVTRKISNSIARIELGLQDTILLGNLEAARDWGYAPEYVEAMWSMMQQTSPEDLVIATGEAHSVREFVEAACAIVGRNWQDVVEESPDLKRPLDIPALCGDASRAKAKLGWAPRTTFKQLVEIMVEEDLRRWRDYLAGRVFPWDAANAVY